MSMETYFEISESGNLVRVEALEYEYEGQDKRWIKSKITVKGGSFKGEYAADIMSFDFASFRKNFDSLYDNLSGVAEFYDIEEYLNLKIKGDGFGHFEMKVQACDKPGVDASYLTFSIVFDQTYIKGISKQLKNITDKFPVKGF